MSQDAAQVTESFFDAWRAVQKTWQDAFESFARVFADAARPGEQQRPKDFYSSWLDAYQKSMNSLLRVPASFPLRNSLELLLASANSWMKLQKSWLKSLQNMPGADFVAAGAESWARWVEGNRELFKAMVGFELPEPFKQWTAPMAAIQKNVFEALERLLAQLGQANEGLWKPWLQAWEKLVRQSADALASTDGGVEAFGRFQDTWLAAYRETLGRMLRIPPIGPARLTWEKVLKTLDAWFKYIGASIDFAFRVYEPATRAFETVAEKSRQLFSEGVTPDSMKELYNLTLQVYEESFHHLFKSESYTRGMHLLLNQMLDLKRASDELAEELLRETPVVTRSEADEIYQVLHVMRKELREIGRRLERLEASRGGRK